ncbi:MAG: glycosyltransferase family 4 protein [Parvularculaceae bacterium]|nr:glycosyltransferase family 4 protein [Parvularculaceae bacterium]
MTKALKIALINTFYPPYNFGGDGVYVRRLAHALARRGCEVHVLHDTETYRALSSRKDAPLAPLDEPPGVTVTPLKSPLGAVASIVTHQTGRPLAYGGALKRFFDQEFDVTHFHNVSLAGGPGILSMGSGVRLYTAHEHWLVCPTHILWRHKRELCDRRECVKCQLVYHRPPQLWRMTGFLERQAKSIDAFIALSQSSADNHSRFGFPFEMTVLPSFLPNEGSPAPGGASFAAERPYALFVGRLEAIKGLQDLIPAFRKDGAIDLVVVGEGDYGDDLRRLAGDSPRVRFLGRRPAEELGAIYAGAVAVVLPSVCYEVFPLVALEAFRAGAPIVARRLGPFPEIIEKSGAGFLFDTSAEAIGAVERLAADPGLRRELGEKGREAFAAHWSEDAALQAYFNLIGRKAAAKGLFGLADRARALVPA